MLSRLTTLSLPPVYARALAVFQATRVGGPLSIRARIVVLALFAALLAHCALPSPPPRTTAGVAELLGREVGGEVRPDDYVWEKRGGFWTDEFWGRSVLFLGRPGGSSRRDLFRARVRLTRAGRALSVSGLSNLSRTPLDDDADLAAQGNAVAVSMQSDRGVLGVRLYDLSGEGALREASTWGTRLRASIENIVQFGNSRGIAITEIAFDAPPPQLRFELGEDLLVLALGPEGEPASLDLRSLALNPGPKNPYRASVRTIPHRVRPSSRFVGQVARPLLGATLSKLSEEAWLRVSDFGVSLHRPAPLPAWSAPPVEEGPGGWPPPRVSDLAPRAGNADGGWRPATGVRAGEGAFAPAYETAVGGSGGAVIRLVALDTRQLDLGYAPGYEVPRVALGPGGSGHLPEGNVIAVFNGVASARPISDDVELGASAGGRLLAPALPGGEAIAIDRRGALLAGTFASAPPLADFPFWRQTEDAWLGNKSAERPTHCDNCVIERSALGVTRSGMILYAWSRRGTASDLRNALAAAGCDLALPLALRPASMGFAILEPPGPEVATHGEAVARKIDPAMTFIAPSASRPAAEEFFYAKVRDFRPHAPLPPSSPGAGWTPDPAGAPPPAWLPAIHEASVASLGAQVHLLALSPDRFVFRLRAGGKEIVASRGGVQLPAALEETDVPRALAAIGLATGRRKAPRGLAIGGVAGLPMRGEGGLLVVEPERGTIAIQIAREGLSIAPATDATELPLTGDDGKLLPAARTLGSMRSRAAACVLEDGTLILASTTFDSDEANTAVLLDVGCTRVVALDRGSHSPAFVNRRGESPLEARYEATVLYAIAKEMRGRAAAKK